MKRKETKTKRTPINQGTKDETFAGKNQELVVDSLLPTDAGEKPLQKSKQPRYHSRTVTSPGPGYFVCDLCQTGFENRQDLEEHLLEAHPTEAYTGTTSKN
jgi:hypothetical protein